MAHHYERTSVYGGQVIQGNYYEQPNITRNFIASRDRNTRKEPTLEELSAWLSELNFSAPLYFHCKKRVTGTCTWLFEDPAVRRWIYRGWLEDARTFKDADDPPRYPSVHNGLPSEPLVRVLWLCGDPGVGKTMLCATLIERLKSITSNHDAIIYCFFDYARVQELTAEAVLANLLLQLLTVDFNGRFDAFKEFFIGAEGVRRNATIQELNVFFEQICGLFRTVYIVIDGFDEAEHSTRRQLLSSLEGGISNNVLLCIAGRPNAVFSSYMNAPFATVLVQAQQADLCLYIEERIADDEDLSYIVNYSNIKAKDLIDKVIYKADFSFLATELQINAIQQAGPVTEAELNDALKASTVDVPAIYDTTMYRLKNQPATKARIGLATLGWLAKALRTLSSQELLHAVGLETSFNTFSWQHAPPLNTVLSSCLGLVKYDQARDEVRLVHYTLLEYFDQRKVELLSHKAALEGCLRCLSDPSLSSMLTRPRHLLDQNVPFLKYATQYWIRHVREDLEESVELLHYLSKGTQIEIWRTLVLRIGSRESMPRAVQKYLDYLPFPYPGCQLAIALQWKQTTEAFLNTLDLNVQKIAALLLVAVRAENHHATESLVSRGARPSAQYFDFTSAECDEIMRSPFALDRLISAIQTRALARASERASKRASKRQLQQALALRMPNQEHRPGCDCGTVCYCEADENVIPCDDDDDDDDYDAEDDLVEMRFPRRRQ